MIKAVGVVRAVGRGGLMLESAVSTGIPLAVWHFLVGRRRLVANTGVDLQHQLDAVLRHFPSPGAASGAAILGFFGGLDEWLA